ncbi:MAG: hypothetical protein JWM21_1191 [Acidobacteria bacterium]|nr:hypothetical protein [Acidobacteriota bacterium]
MIYSNWMREIGHTALKKRLHKVEPAPIRRFGAGFAHKNLQVTGIPERHWPSGGSVGDAGWSLFTCMVLEFESA